MSHHLTALPDDHQPWRGPRTARTNGARHEALIEAADCEDESAWRGILVRIADTQSPRN
jgi:hypothetical protein